MKSPVVLPPPLREKPWLPRERWWRESDPGFYLIGGGARAFESRIGYRPLFSQRFWRAAAATGLAGYVGLLALTTGCFAALALTGINAAG